MECYPIRKLAKVSFPRSLIFFDTESFINVFNIENQERIRVGLEPLIKETPNEDEKHCLRLGAAIEVKLDDKANVTERYKHWFKDSLSFWKFVEKYNNRNHYLYVVAHNIKYDLTNVKVFEDLTQLGYTLDYPIMGHAFIMSAHKDRPNGKRYKTIVFIDSFNFIKTSLKEMGKKFGLAKKEIEDFRKATDEELYPYCERDTEVVEKFIIDFIQFLVRNDLGSFKNTLASTALAVYRHKFISHDIFYYDDSEIIRLERTAYKGGRVECFRVGKLDTKLTYCYLDVNSMYPTVMRNNKLPVKPVLKLENVPLSDFKIFMQTSYAIADVLITTDKPIYGVKHDDKLLFPIGTFRTVLHQPELERAIQDESILKIYQVVFYDTAEVFKEYIDFFYQIKSHPKTKVERELAKLFMNSLYGKFAMRLYKTNKPDDLSGIDFYDEGVKFASQAIRLKVNGKNVSKNLTYWFGKWYHTDIIEDQMNKNTNVALAGAVTAYARMLLLKYIEIAGWENLRYVDTDSLLVTMKGYTNLQKLGYIDNDELGMLKSEQIYNVWGSFTHDVTLVAPKNYKIGDRRRSKGIPISATTDENGNYQFWRFTTIKDTIRSKGEIFGRVMVTKHNSDSYEKGNVLESGLVEPYKMEYTETCKNQITNQLKKKIRLSVKRKLKQTI